MTRKCLNEATSKIKTVSSQDLVKIIFLDIDGVLQPEYPAVRFTDFDVKNILIQTPCGAKQPQLIEEIVARHNTEKMSSLDCLHAYLAEIDSGYNSLDKYDIAAACGDWNKESVELLRRLCDSTGAKLVISSDWRLGKTLEQLKLLFKIHELDNFVMDMVIPVFGEHPVQVKEYITTHPNIERFVILDDDYHQEFEQMFPSEFIYHTYCFNVELYYKAEYLLLK